MMLQSFNGGLKLVVNMQLFVFIKPRIPGGNFCCAPYMQFVCDSIFSSLGCAGARGIPKDRPIRYGQKLGSSLHRSLVGLFCCMSRSMVPDTIGSVPACSLHRTPTPPPSTPTPRIDAGGSLMHN